MPKKKKKKKLKYGFGTNSGNMCVCTFSKSVYFNSFLEQQDITSVFKRPPEIF